MKLPKELTTVTPLSKAVALVIFIGLPIIAFIFGMNYQTFLNNFKSPSTGTACTQETKICPDGSFVSRIGPNCDFAPCPQEDIDWGIKPPTSPVDYECPESGYIDCMPGPIDSRKNYSPQYIRWAEENCPDFKGCAY